MPKIPLSQTGRLDHQRSTAPITNLTDAGAGMDVPRQLGNLAGIIGQGADRLAGSIARAGMARDEFDNALTDTENKLAAIDDRNLFQRYQQDLEQKLAANPGADDKDKLRWITQTDERYREARAEILDRMTPNFRRLHDAAMTGERQQAADRRQQLIIQGAATRARNDALAKYDTALRDNNIALAGEIVTTFEGSIFSAEQAKKLRDDIPRLAQSYAAQKRVSDNDPGILDDLEAGKVYPAIPDDYRQKLIRTARANDARRRGDQNVQLYFDLLSGNLTSKDQIRKTFGDNPSPRDLKQMKFQFELFDRHQKHLEQEDAERRLEENFQLYNDLRDGKVITEADINRRFEGKTSRADLEQKKQQHEILYQFKRRQQLIAQGERAAQNHRNAEDERQRAAAERAAKKAEQEQAKLRRQKINSDLFDIITREFSGEPAKREVEFQLMREDILKKYIGDGNTADRLLNALDRRHSKFPAPGAPPAAAPQQPEELTRLMIIDYAKEKAGKNGIEIYEKPGKWSKSSKINGVDVAKANGEMMKKKTAEWIKNHPGANLDEAREWVDQSVEFIGSQAYGDNGKEINAAWRDLPQVPGVDLQRLRGEMAANYRRAVVEADAWYREHPKATTDEIKAKIDELVAGFNRELAAQARF